MLGREPLGRGDPYVLSCQLGHWATNAAPSPAPPHLTLYFLQEFKEGKSDVQLCLCFCLDIQDQEEWNLDSWLSWLQRPNTSLARLPGP